MGTACGNGCQTKNRTAIFFLTGARGGGKVASAFCPKVAVLENARRSQRRAFCFSGLFTVPSQRPDALPSGKAWPQVTICSRASVEACAAVRARFGVPSLRVLRLDIAHRASGLHVATVVGSCTIACKKPRCFTVQWSGMQTEPPPVHATWRIQHGQRQHVE